MSARIEAAGVEFIAENGGGAAVFSARDLGHEGMISSQPSLPLVLRFSKFVLLIIGHFLHLGGSLAKFAGEPTEPIHKGRVRLWEQMGKAYRPLDGSVLWVRAGRDCLDWKRQDMSGSYARYDLPQTEPSPALPLICRCNGESAVGALPRVRCRKSYGNDQNIDKGKAILPGPSVSRFDPR
jgi:hypothetical protein